MSVERSQPDTHFLDFLRFQQSSQMYNTEAMMKKTQELQEAETWL